MQVSIKKDKIFCNIDSSKGMSRWCWLRPNFYILRFLTKIDKKLATKNFKMIT